MLVNRVCRSDHELQIGNNRGFGLALVSRIVPSLLGIALLEKGEGKEKVKVEIEIKQGSAAECLAA